MENNEGQKPKAKLSGNGIFLLSVGSIASVVGFGYTYMTSKKNELKEITSQQTSQKVKEQVLLMKDGTRLASRALAYSWLWSIGGVSLVAFAAWKLSGARNLEDFRRQAGTALPRIPKSENPGRVEFESLKDLADYLESEDEKIVASKEK